MCRRRQDFGRHVAACSSGLAAWNAAATHANTAGKAKVRNLEPKQTAATIDQEDILGLQVAMANLEIVHGLHPHCARGWRESSKARASRGL